MNSGVYKIVNSITKKFYVGSSKNIALRWNNHVSALNAGKHENRHLLRAWEKYGSKNFSFEIVEKCENDALIEREQYYLDLYNSVGTGYNICPVARSCAGRLLTDETKQRISKSNKGMPQSEETKRKISKSCLGRRSWNLGNVRPKEVKENISKSKRKEHAIKNGEELKWCNKCKNYFSLLLFPKSKKTWDGLHFCCKKCRNEQNRAYHKG